MNGLDLIRKEEFSFIDIDFAFNTGVDYPTDEERHKGKYAYNSDMGKDKKNHYGIHLYNQMHTTKKLMILALNKKIEDNNMKIKSLTELIKENNSQIKQTDIDKLKNENENLMSIKYKLESVKL